MMKIKSVFVLILMFLSYWLGIPYLLAVSFGIFSLWVDSTCMLVFLNSSFVLLSIPFLYFLFKATGLALIDRKKTCRHASYSLLKLLPVGIILAALSVAYKYFFYSTPVVQEGATQPVSGIATAAICAVLLSPITEEFFFRKWMISYLEKAEVKPVYILVITSLLFFIAHIDYVHWYLGFDRLLLGIVLSYIYLKERDIRNCIWVHFVNNLIVIPIGLVYP